MGKVIILNLLEGSFSKGFHVTCEIAQEGETHFAYEEGRLPRDLEIPQLYQRWQSLYRSLIAGAEPFRRVTGVNVTNVSIPEIRIANQQLEARMKQWLDATGMRFIVEQIYQHLKDDHEEIRIVFRTRSPELQRLPWHCWKIFDRYPQAEAVLSLPVRKPRKAPPTDRVKILVVLGDTSTYGEATQIGIDKDLESLHTLPNAEIIPLNQPSLEHLDTALWTHSPEILFFAGHSASEMDGRRGSIYLNSQEVITIGVLKPAIRNAVSRGLQLAIFNSCDGLGIVQELAELYIPQVIVMREPVPDVVAQNFLSHFIKGFAQGQSLCLAVKQARERVHRWEHYYPGVTWLPMIFQNPAEKPYTWRQIQGLPTIVGAESPTLTEEYSPEARPPDPQTIIIPPTTQVIQDQPPQEFVPAIPPTIRHCQKCRSAVLQTDLFCSNCGFKLNQAPAQTEHSPAALRPIASVLQSQPALPPTQTGSEPQSTFSELLPGSVVGSRYEVIQLLGSGGFSKTMLAKDQYLPTQPLCVIKQLRFSFNHLEAFEKVKALFDREANVLFRLGEHGQIPRLFAHFTENSEFYLVQEYIDGVELYQELAKRTDWTESDVILLLEDVLGILTFIHEKGVIHRDVKPSNLIRRKSDSRMVLIDFGAVEQIFSADFERTRTIIGTSGYMPVEQAMGKPRPSSDIYALGMIGVQILTGVVPYSLPEDPETGNVMWRDRCRLQTMTPGLADIIDKMISYNFSQRYRITTEVLQDLAKLPH